MQPGDVEDRRDGADHKPVQAEENQGVVADVRQGREWWADTAGLDKRYIITMISDWVTRYPAGKVEAELILMGTDEAEKTPAGLGREEPNALEKPT